MTQTNAATTDTNTTEAKAPSKMDLVRPIFKEIYAKGYKLSEGCKSQRSEFIKRAQAEAGMTKNGAATYFQNLSNEAKGQSLYKYNSTKKADVSSTESGASEAANQANSAAVANATQLTGSASSVDENSIGQHRWMVVNAADEEISSYPSRDKAKAAAKAAGLEWKDRSAEATE